MMPHATGDTRVLFSIILPVHNEQEVLPMTFRRLVDAADMLEGLGYDCEWVFVNDGSRDNSPQILDDLVSQDARVRAVHLTRNFGHQAAVTAGLSVVRGRVIAIMDADLQDPPDVLPRFLDQWREGFQVVYAIREKRKEGPVKRACYWAFYRLLNAISELEMPLDSGDFCVLDRSAVDLLNKLPERQRFVRGLRTWIGLKQTGVRYERAARAAGTPSYGFRALIKLAVEGMVSFSTVPLRLMTRLGLLGVLCAGLLGIWAVTITIYAWITGADTPRGWASLACLILAMGSIQLLSLGVIGEYLSRVFLEVKQRPSFLIARVSEQKRSSTTRLRGTPVVFGVARELKTLP